MFVCMFVSLLFVLRFHDNKQTYNANTGSIGRIN